MEILPYIPLNAPQEAEDLINEIKLVFPDYASGITEYMGVFLIASPKVFDKDWRSKMPPTLIIPSDMTKVTLEEYPDNGSNLYLHESGILPDPQPQQQEPDNGLVVDPSNT